MQRYGGASRQDWANEVMRPPEKGFAENPHCVALKLVNCRR